MKYNNGFYLLYTIWGITKFRQTNNIYKLHGACTIKVFQPQTKKPYKTLNYAQN